MLSPTRATAPFFFPPLEDAAEAVPVLPAGAVGVKVAEPLARHEVAAAFAALTSEGAALLTVAFPAKLHETGLRLLA